MSNTGKRYSEAFRRQVVADYEAGSSITELQKKYGVTGGQTIQTWIEKYASEGFRRQVIRIQTTEEANQVEELEKQVERLERALARTTLEKLKLESIVEELTAELSAGDMPHPE
jgi:transposase